jgi:predicted CXXCH cytochrome family protein
MIAHARRQVARLALFVLGFAGYAGIAAPDSPFAPHASQSQPVADVRLAAIERSMSGTPHDFSSDLSDDSGSDYCRVCHVFEDGPGGQYVRLTSTASAGNFYSTYRGRDLENTPLQPFGVTQFCLTCHDGTIALDSFGVRMGRINSQSSLGTNLADDHPVSIRYDDSDREIYPDSRPFFFGDGTAGTITDLLEDGAVQCSSCHDIHNVRGAGGSYLLIMSNTRSALCMTCHVR